MDIEVALDIEVASDGIVVPEWSDGFFQHFLRIKAVFLAVLLMQVPGQHDTIEEFRDIVFILALWFYSVVEIVGHVIE